MAEREPGGRACGRRWAMLAALAGVATPLAARGQIVPPAATPPPQITTVPVPAPARPAAPLVTAIDKTKIYYLFFDQAIDAASMRGLRRQLAALVEAGVTQAVLVINSGGGETLPALTTYSFIRSLPMRIDTHAQGFVASAATVLFLAGEGRSADRAARFLFHPTQTTLPGYVNEQQIQERMAVVGNIEGEMKQIYQDRTKLTDQDIQRFGRSEVIYTADQAAQDGIIQTVADLKIPGDQAAKIIFLD